MRRNAREQIFGKIFDSTIVALDWAPKEDAMMVDTQNKSYQNKNKGGPPKTTFSPSTSSHQIDPQSTRGTHSPEVISTSSSSSKYNILKQLSNIKVDAYLFDMVIVSKQQKHLKDFMEGKAFTVSSLTKEQNEEEMYINKLNVYNPRNYVKNPPFYVSVKIMDKITHCCLIDGGSSPNVMSKIIMEELGLSCTNENLKSMLSYNSEQWVTIGENKM